MRPDIKFVLLVAGMVLIGNLLEMVNIPTPVFLGALVLISLAVFIGGILIVLAALPKIFRAAIKGMNRVADRICGVERSTRECEIIMLPTPQNRH